MSVLSACDVAAGVVVAVVSGLLLVTWGGVRRDAAAEPDMAVAVALTAPLVYGSAAAMLYAAARLMGWGPW